MGTFSGFLLPLLAVHISDGVLTAAWCAAGFFVAALLMALAAYRMPSDEEIVRIALLTSAFFVASLIHVRVGPTSVHLLLNGLVGVLLGWRAGLAIATALFLQAALLGHGGMSALGVNSCVLTLPALLAAGLFTVLNRPTWLAQPWYRAILVGSAVVVWSLALVFSVVLLASNRLSLQETPDPTVALQMTFHPVTLAGVGALALAFGWLERRMDHAPEFPLGLLLGLLAVLATTMLDALALHWGGAEDWGSLILLVFVAHLPVAVIEGLILGFTLGFLARVKPELLGLRQAGHGIEALPPSELTIEAREEVPVRSPALLLVLLVPLLTPSVAQAHRLDADYRLLPDGMVEIECWFGLAGDAPRGAKVQVFRRDASLLTEGTVDEKGRFRFPMVGKEPLKVVINAGVGHRKEIRIPGNAEEQIPDDPPPSLVYSSRNRRDDFALMVIGVGVIVAVAGFVLSLRNAWAIRALRKEVNKQV